MASNAYINRIATAVPAYEINRYFVRIGASMLAEHPRQRAVFHRMANASGIDRRYSCFEPARNPNGRVLDARVLVVNVELCTLHLMETTCLEKLLAFCLWGDGCAASLVTSDPHGLQLDRFFVLVDSEHQGLMSWRIEDSGFDMVLSGQVPGAIQRALVANQGDVLNGRRAEEIDLWAVHPGGRSILDAVQRALTLGQGALGVSREVLRQNGNMSSATVMFVLEEMLKAPPGLNGCSMAFGPGLTAETMTFRTV